MIIFVNINNKYNYNFNLKSKKYNGLSNRYEKGYYLKIPKINIYNKVIKANNNFSNLDKSLVYYKSFNINDKIVIFGHSGMGIGTYFNKLYLLEKSDKVFLYDLNNEYEYVVYNIEVINKANTSVLNEEKNSNKLYLITCSKNNKNDRLIVKLMLKRVKSLKN